VIVDENQEAIKTAYEKFSTVEKNYNRINLLEQKKIYTGITGIDEALRGIMDTELVVIGASTGVGKSQIATNIATHTALAGKKAILFALEAYPGEVEDRIKFARISTKHYAKTTSYINFRDWKLGAYLNKEFLELEQEVITETPEAIKKNISIRYRTSCDYTIDMLEQELDDVLCFKEADIIIIDHLHYFSFPDGESENKAIKRIINKLRDIGLQTNIPIILFSHLRKKDKFNKTKIPDITEFHGSSEITKNPTCVITMAPAYDIDPPSTYQFPTYFRICKDRFDGSLKRYAFSTIFNARTGDYDKVYKLFKVINSGEDLEEISREMRPGWAQSAYFSEHEFMLKG
jgi:replicative DNA helicase